MRLSLLLSFLSVLVVAGCAPLNSDFRHFKARETNLKSEIKKQRAIIDKLNGNVCASLYQRAGKESLKIVWYLFLLAVISVFQKQTRCFSNWNTLTVFLSLLIIQHSLYAPFCLETLFLRLNLEVSPKTTIAFFLNQILMYIFILAGVVFINRRYAFSAGDTKARMEITGAPGCNNRVFFLLCVFLVLTTLFKVVSGAPELSLKHFVFRNIAPLDYQNARLVFNQATASSKSVFFYIANVSIYGIFPLLIFLGFFLKEKLIFRLIFSFLLFIYIASGLVSGQKAPVIYILCGLLICYLLRNNKFALKIPYFRLFLLAGPVLFLVVPYLYSVQYSHLNYFSALVGMWDRIALFPNLVLIPYFHTYPDIHPHLLGLSMEKISIFFSWFGFDKAIAPYKYVFSSLIPDMTANVVFIGDAWADFSYLGTIVESFFVGCLLQWYNIWFSRAKKTFLVLATYVAIIMSASTLASVGLGTALVTCGVGLIFIVYLLLKNR